MYQSRFQKLLENKAHLVKTYGEKLVQTYQQKEPDARRMKKEDITPDFVLSKLEPVDPSQGKKFREWIIRMYVKGEFIIAEDTPKIRSEIENFLTNKNKLEKKDLGAYRSLNDLYDALEAVQDKPEEKSKTQLQKEKDAEIRDKGAEWLMDKPDFKVLIPKNIDASRKYGANTKWCTASDGDYGLQNFNYYAKKGDLTIVMARFSDGKFHKFQFHFSTHSFMNERDQPATPKEIEELSAHDEWLETLHMLIDKHMGK